MGERNMYFPRPFMYFSGAVTLPDSEKGRELRPIQNLPVRKAPLDFFGEPRLQLFHQFARINVLRASEFVAFDFAFAFIQIERSVGIPLQ